MIVGLWRRWPELLGIIGGTGLYQLEGLDTRALPVDTPYGAPSAPLQELPGKAVFVTRHGVDHSIPPHRINYRANIQALYQCGVRHILSFNAVGGCSQAFAPGRLFMPQQLIDYSYGREHSFHERLDNFADHIDFTEPFSAELQQRLVAVAQRCAIPVTVQGTYGCTQGPRFETAAEIRRLQRDGCDLVGMTAMPEAALAAERGMAYASLCVVVNYAAGVEPVMPAMVEIERTMQEAMVKVHRLVAGVLDELPW